MKWYDFIKQTAIVDDKNGIVFFIVWQVNTNQNPHVVSWSSKKFDKINDQAIDEAWEEFTKQLDRDVIGEDEKYFVTLAPVRRIPEAWDGFIRFYYN